jgi:hypothetical protein
MTARRKIGEWLNRLKKMCVFMVLISIEGFEFAPGKLGFPEKVGQKIGTAKCAKHI